MTRALVGNAAKHKLYSGGWVMPLQDGRYYGVGETSFELMAKELNEFSRRLFALRAERLTDSASNIGDVHYLRAVLP